MNFERLYQDAQKVYPIDLIAFQVNLKDKKFVIVVSDAKTGAPEYIELSREDYINEMLATGALPVLMKDPICLNGKRKVQKALRWRLYYRYEQAFIRKTKLENYSFCHTRISEYF